MIAAVLWFFAGAFIGPIALTLINLTLSSAGFGIALALRSLSKPGRLIRLIFSFGATAALYGVLSWIGIRITLYLWDFAHPGFKWGLIIASIYPAIMCLFSLVAIPGSIATATDEEIDEGEVKAEIPVKVAFALYGVALLIFVFANSFYVETVEVTPEGLEHARMLKEIMSDPAKMVDYGNAHIALGHIDEGIAILEEASSYFPESEVVEDAIRQAREDFGRKNATQ